MATELGPGDAPAPAAFGPFHRLESPTQTPDDARLQKESGEIWGKTPKASAWPQVEAFRGPLPSDARGIEFYTDAAPDGGGHPRRVAWSGEREGVRVEGEFAKITCVIVKDTQTKGGEYG